MVQLSQKLYLCVVMFVRKRFLVCATCLIQLRYLFGHGSREKERASVSGNNFQDLINLGVGEEETF